MRAGIVAVVLAACSGDYDPLDGVPHREYPDTASAVREVLETAGAPRVFAVGEYHPTGDHVARTPLARFTSDVLPILRPLAHHLLVEAWFDAACDGAGDPVQAQIAAATRRAPQQQVDLDTLVARMPTHGLPMTCIEHASMLDPRGHVDFLRLLLVITEKLYETTRALADGGRTVVVYGGALHNDLYPQWPLEDLAYGHALARDLSVLELDLVVPEVVRPVKALWREPWFPLVAKAAPDRALVWERGPASYVIVLPAEPL